MIKMGEKRTIDTIMDSSEEDEATEPKKKRPKVPCIIQSCINISDRYFKSTRGELSAVVKVSLVW